MVEHRDKTTTEGRGLGHSWADDNVVRGDPDVDFVKRRPTYPIGDDPRGREIDFQDTSGKESYGSTRNPVVRAFRGQAPIEGQKFGMPVRKGKIFQNIRELNPELPNRSVNTIVHAALQANQDAELLASNNLAKYPTVTISSPAPGATFSPGDSISIDAPASALLNLYSATLEIDGVAVDRRVIDRRDQFSTTDYTFKFIYPVPADRALGGMTITVRAFNIESSFRGMIADDAFNSSTIRTGLPTLDGRPGSATSSEDYQKLLGQSGIMKSPEGVVSIVVNIV